jgi:adenylylsulfate kinase
MQDAAFLKILIMGLPGSGKTTLAKTLHDLLLFNRYDSCWLNADKVREQFNDWDFSDQGRERQAIRMMSLANLKGQYDDIIICDFVCPLQKYRNIFDPDILVYMNTIDKSRYEDTNSIFEPPIKPDLEVLKLDSHLYAKIIFQQIVHILDKKCN